MGFTFFPRIIEQGFRMMVYGGSMNYGFAIPWVLIRLIISGSVEELNPEPERDLKEGNFYFVVPSR
jgi:hypothetical protein